MRKVRIPKSLITRPPSSLIYSCEIKSRRRSVIAHACGTTGRGECASGDGEEWEVEEE